jgi:hypothetical protein
MPWYERRKEGELTDRFGSGGGLDPSRRQQVNHDARMADVRRAAEARHRHGLPTNESGTGWRIVGLAVLLIIAAGLVAILSNGGA